MAKSTSPMKSAPAKGCDPLAPKRAHWLLRSALALGAPLMVVADAACSFAACLLAAGFIQAHRQPWSEVAWGAGPWAAAVLAACLGMWAWAAGESPRRGASPALSSLMWLLGGAFGAHRAFSGQWRSALAMALAWTAGGFLSMSAAKLALSIGDQPIGPAVALPMAGFSIPLGAAVSGAAALALMLTAGLWALADGIRIGAGRR